MHTINNACLVAAGLLWADGDFSRAICLTVMGGLDPDSNGATAGSVAGILNGRRAIPDQWSEPLEDRIRSDLAGFDGIRISELGDRTLRLIERTGSASVRIVGLETLRVDDFPNLLYVRIHTDEGVTGLGETFYGAEAVETHLHAVAAPLLLGEDPLRIEHHAGQLAGYVGYHGSGVETRARSAVDLALWDILGQAAGQPVYNLLGGLSRERIPIYNTCAGSGYVNSARGQAVDNWGVRQGQYEDLHAAIHRPAELAKELWDMGVQGMKVWPFDEYAEASGGHRISPSELAGGLDRIAAIREAAPEMNVMVELHALWDVPTALTILNALEPYRPFWVEDPSGATSWTAWRGSHRRRPFGLRRERRWRVPEASWQFLPARRSAW